MWFYNKTLPGKHAYLCMGFRDLWSLLLLSYLAPTSWAFNTSACWLCTTFRISPGVHNHQSLILFFFFLPFLSPFEAKLGQRDRRVNHYCWISEPLESRAFGSSSEDITGLDITLHLFFYCFLSCCDSDNPSTECSLNSSQFYPKQESTWIIHFL